MTATFAPMQYDSVDVADADGFLSDDGWVAQHKADGYRCLVVIEPITMHFLTRGGRPMATMRSQITGLRRTLQQSKWRGTWALDGELMHDGTFWVFDLPVASSAGIALNATPLSRRLEALELLPGIAGWPRDGIVRVLPTATGTRAKRALWRSVQRTGGEGIVVKRLDGRYVPPRSKSQRTSDVLKVKLTKTVDCVVAEVTTAPNSVTLAMLVGTSAMRVVGRAKNLLGNVVVGDVVEVRCLYVGAGGRLTQPVLMRKRTDKAARDCTIDQLDGLAVNKEISA